ncbi:hypothetical protein Bbelb_038300 [Branchiostoma belcheri]|nr:hypothetical protein Bbelb_038300 [Branchiostoma belcheri]
MGCLQRQKNLDQRARPQGLGETEETQRQEAHPQSSGHPSERSADSKHQGSSPVVTEPVGQSDQEPGVEEAEELRKARVKWPPGNADKQWEQLDEDLEGILEGVLAGSVERKLEALVKVVYNDKERRRQKEKKRAEFMSNPFRFTKRLLGAKTSGRLTCSKEEAESYLQKTHGDVEREVPLEDRPKDEFPDPEQPTRELDCSELKLAEVKDVIRKARAGAAPGPSGIIYRVYKKCPRLTRRLWSLLKVVWRKKKLPQGWKKAEGVFCPKQENARGIEQFRTISLLSVEGKIFFAVLAKRLLKYMMDNNYIDTSIQKGGVPGCSGCLEHTSILSQLIQEAKAGKKDLAIVWLDLQNAYGSVPHQLIKVALEKYYVPEPVRLLIEQYMDGLMIRFTVNGYTTSWQRLQKGIITGCTISVILFVAAMNLVMKPALGQARGPKTDSGIRQRPLKAFMDDLTVTTESVISARYVLRSLSKAASWARMKFKAKKCRKLVMRRGKICDKLQLEVQGERIPAIAEQPIKSLGKKFDVKLSDKKNIEEFKQQMRDGLEAIENSELPGRYKVWCYQYGLLPRAVWPMTMYDIPLTVVEEVERRVSRHLRKWLGVPPGLTSIGLYSKTAKLQLPLTSMEEEYKVTKARAQLMLQESRDELVSQAGIRLRSGKTWAAAEAVASATSRLKHRDIVGVVAQGRRGFGAGREGTQRWGTASPRERRELIQKEVRQQEEEVRRSRAVSQGVQGAWTRWEGVRERKVMWNELMYTEPSKIRFLLKSVYDLLPTAANLKRWRKKDEDKCELCGKTGNLSHVLTSCPVALGKGRYTWRHNQVLKVIASAVEEQITENKVKGKQRKGLQFISFAKEDGKERENDPGSAARIDCSLGGQDGRSERAETNEVSGTGIPPNNHSPGSEWPSLSPRWLETYCNKGRNVKESQFAADDGEWRAESDPLAMEEYREDFTFEESIENEAVCQIRKQIYEKITVKVIKHLSLLQQNFCTRLALRAVRTEDSRHHCN